MRRALQIAALCACSSAGVAPAQEIWQDQWREFGAADLALTAAFGGVIAVSSALPPKRARWNREILLDLPTRRALGAESENAEDTAAVVSDGLVVGLLVAPFADLATVTYARHDLRFAETFSGVAMESLALNFALANGVKVVAARERPRRAACFGDTPGVCPWREPVSFFSGHSSGAFAGAGLVCALESIGDVHGKGIAAQIPCVTALGAATAAAVLRVVANKHHLSDIVVGAIVGLSAGWAWPTARFAWSQ